MENRKFRTRDANRVKRLKKASVYGASQADPAVARRFCIRLFGKEAYSALEREYRKGAVEGPSNWIKALLQRSIEGRK